MSSFTVTLKTETLNRGLRPTQRAQRNAGYLVKADGVVGRDGVLSAIDDITRMDTSAITDGFPFPQIFVFTSMIIVCGLKTIYEVDSNGSLSLKYTATTPCGTWDAVDFYDYVYLSNGIEAVIRDAGTKAYALSSTQPHFTSVCNFNGQVVIGAPDAVVDGASLSMKAGVLELTVSQQGSWS